MSGKSTIEQQNIQNSPEREYLTVEVAKRFEDEVSEIIKNHSNSTQASTSRTVSCEASTPLSPESVDAAAAGENPEEKIPAAATKSLPPEVLRGDLDHAGAPREWLEANGYGPDGIKKVETGQDSAAVAQ